MTKQVNQVRVGETIRTFYTDGHGIKVESIIQRNGLVQIKGKRMFDFSQTSIEMAPSQFVEVIG